MYIKDGIWEVEQVRYKFGFLIRSNMEQDSILGEYVDDK